MNVILYGADGHMGINVIHSAADGPVRAEITAKVSPTIEVGEAFPDHYKTLTEYQGPADVVVDFSHHSATKDLMDYCRARKLPVVVCTTGQTEEEKQYIRDSASDIPVFFSGNMSVGIAVLTDLVKKAAAAFPDADIEIVEIHHNRKLDVPSGTALMLADAVKQARPQASFLVGRHENGKRTKEEVGIHSLRMGNVTGVHEVIITTGNETITLKHQAENRALFAEGALRAAAYLCGKQPGLYTMKDMLG